MKHEVHPRHIIVYAGDVSCEWPQWDSIPQDGRAQGSGTKGDPLGIAMVELGMREPHSNVDNIDKILQESTSTRTCRRTCMTTST